MSAETIPAEVHATMLWALKRWRTSMQPDDLLRAMLEAPVVQGWLADRSTRPAEPAPEVEVGPYPASNALEAEMREVEVGDGEVVAWAKPRGPWVMGEKFIWDEDRTEDWMMGIFTEPLVRRSTLEAERAKTAAAEAMTAHETAIRQEACRRADQNAERAEEADRLRVEHAVRAEAAETSLSRALQDRDEAVRVAVEDEREACARIADAAGQAAAISADRKQATSQSGTSVLTGYVFAKTEAEAIARDIRARRARLRADQRAGEGGAA